MAGYTAYRIPACFVNAHAFAGTMVSTLPWLVGGVVPAGQPPVAAGLLWTAVGAAVLGVFMSATRIGMLVLLCCLVLCAPLPAGCAAATCVAWLAAAGAVG